MIRLGIDAMGGDFAPLEVVKSFTLLAGDSFLAKNVKIYCFGRIEELSTLFNEFSITDLAIDIEIVNCLQVIDYHDQPTKALKEKANASIFEGFKWLAENKIDSWISAGNTGAMLIGVKFYLKSLPTIQRPFLISLMPKTNGDFGLFTDIGLNTDCKPEHLNQFATISSVFATEVYNIKDPKVVLLNIGEEESKGNLLCQQAYKLLSENTNIHFKGNREGRDFYTNDYDILICDGFVGNILLKLSESLYQIAIEKGLKDDPFFAKLNYEKYGGMPILGIEKSVIIGHGISTAEAFKNMLLLGYKMASTEVCQKILTKLRNEK